MVSIRRRKLEYRREGLLPSAIETVWMRSTGEEKSIVVLPAHTEVYDIVRKTRDNGWWFNERGSPGFHWTMYHPFGILSNPDRGPMLRDDTPSEWRDLAIQVEKTLAITRDHLGEKLRGHDPLDIMLDLMRHVKKSDMKIALTLTGER